MRARYLFNSIAWMMMSLYSARNIPLFAIITAPILAQGFDSFLIDSNWNVGIIKKINEINKKLTNFDSQFKGFFLPILVLIFLTAGMLLGFRFDSSGNPYGYDPERFPVEAVDWLEEHPQEGEVFNYFIWGGYLLNRLWPDQLVFIDGQTDIYGEALTREYVQVIQVEVGWQEVLNQHAVDWAILPTDSLAARVIHSELGWDVIYQDGTAMILHK